MKSVITCDNEGIIKTLNKDAESIFGYKANELIGKKRVSLFSPGEIVLQNVPIWLEEASKKGEYVTKTQFIRKDDSIFNAKIKITPTFENGKDKPQTGFCGVTEPIDEKIDVKIKIGTKIIKALAITRLPFITAVIAPALIGGAYAYNYFLSPISIGFPIFNFILVLLGIIFLHLGSNVMNDYFDVKDGTDDANNDYFVQYSGGSRAIELGLITLKGTKKLGVLLLAIGISIGLYLVYQTGLPTLYIGILGLGIGYFYTAPPVRLVAKKGLGEFAICLAFGPLVTMGTIFVLTQQLNFITFLIGLPAGLLTTNILLINEFPDAESDEKTGKNHLVVTYGKEKSIQFYLRFLIFAVLSCIAISFYLPTLNYFLIAVGLFILLFGLKIVKHIKANYLKRTLVASNINTIKLSALGGILISLALLLG